ncbi:MAG: hypothetical protein ACTSPZ_09605 [Promethearchaeota archaeon]
MKSVLLISSASISLFFKESSAVAKIVPSSTIILGFGSSVIES